MRFNITTTSFEKPNPWKPLPRMSRRRLHGTYYAWWRVEIMAPNSTYQAYQVWMAMVVYLYSKFVRISLPERTQNNAYFVASLEGRMYSALQRFFNARSINLLRRQLLWEIRRLDADQQRSKILQAIDQLSHIYAEGYMDACPLPVTILPGSFESKR